MTGLNTTLIFTKKGPICTIPCTWLYAKKVTLLHYHTALGLADKASSSSDTDLFADLVGVRTLFENAYEEVFIKTINARSEA